MRTYTRRETGNSGAWPSALLEKGAKVTLVIPGGGMMGCDHRSKRVVRQVSAGSPETILLADSMRHKKGISLNKLVASGDPFVLLAGHPDFPLFEGDMTREDGFRSFVLDGTGGRFNGQPGKDAVIAYLKDNCMIHGLDTLKRAILCGDRREDAGVDFKGELLEAMGPAFDRTPFGTKPAAPVRRKSLLTESLRATLLAAGVNSALEPVVVHAKIFDPEGAGTWLLCSMEPDGDTLWGYCDIGQGVVEYGTVSLRELETTKGRFGLHKERDLHFTRCDYTGAELMAMDRIPTLLRKESQLVS
jgi:hypothetical protein